jgi:hypothetical protein
MGFRSSMIACAALAAATLGGAPVQAAELFNGSFEDILNDWAADPSLFQTPGEFEHRAENGSADKKYTPVDGALLGVIQAGAGDVEVLIAQTFTTKGGMFFGSAAFLAEDFPDFNDFGFVRLRHGADVIPLFSSDIAAVGAFGFTEWTGFSTQLAAGTYTLEAGVVNAIDEFNPSFLLVDDFHMDLVPEPSAWALMIAGFGLAGAALRRRRAATA